MAGVFVPLLDPAGLAALRDALTPFTPDAVDDALGPVGRSALARADLSGAARALHGDDGPVAQLVRLFTLGATLDHDAARRALGGAFDAAVAGGLVERDGDSVRAVLDVRPYSEAGGAGQDAPPWWVVSDLGAEVRDPREGGLPADHVLGVGAASTTLAHATMRPRVGRALDLGTGSGVQALHLSRHADTVTATDLSERALRMAATTAALSGTRFDLRQGSFLDPVTGERFDLVVANPPFVVSPGDGGYDYRDSGLPGDGVSRLLDGGLPGLLAPGGTAQLLANWVVPARGSWQDRVGGWLAGTDCDAWVWQREVAELGEYVTLWLRDAGFAPGSAEWTQRYDRWLDWFRDHDVAAIGMGLITLWAGDPTTSCVVAEDVPQAVAPPIGDEIASWIGRQRWLAGTSDADLLRSPVRPAPDLVRTRDDLLDGERGWATRRETLRQSHGMRWEIEADDAVVSLVAACDAGATPASALEVLAAVTDEDADDLARRFAPVLRDLVGRGVLLPAADR